MTTEAQTKDLLEVIRAAQGGDLTVRAHDASPALRPLAQALNGLLESMSQTVSQIATQSHAALAATAEVSRVLQTMTSGLSRQQTAVTEIVRRLKALEARSDEIGQIVELFDDVTSETNMLALNAAIEASRAGAQGKAFGLVAEDVRKLAERSAAATKDIGAFVQTIVNSTSEANLTVEEISRLTQDLGKSAQLASQESTSLSQASAALMQTLSGLRFAGQDEADLTRALRDRKAQLASLLSPLAPLLDRAPTPLGDALRRVLAALDEATEPR